MPLGKEAKSKQDDFPITTKLTNDASSNAMLAL
jgi:hypothetical protein